MRAATVICWFSKNPEHKIVRFGRYYRRSDKRYIRRFGCLNCKRTFSTATGDLCFGQNKRHLNPIIEEHMAALVSMRECARLLKIDKKTVARKLIFLGIEALKWLSDFRKTRQVSKLQFDEMVTFEHTKCKPLSIPLAVEKGTRLILGFKVASMPATGRLAKKAVKRYGPRADQRKQARNAMFEELKDCLSSDPIEIESDMNPHYPPEVKAHFPNAAHRTTKGRRGCVVGQGELKSGGFDPLFSLNHTCAMYRANVSRLIRKTWCTTKKADRLLLHLAIYSKSHNLRILSAT